ncbi:MAG: acireductone synthase [Candidatus Melainabacteria bacterium]|nr:acireductone synthase [Candidatus Melainabacteria bacterium]
MFIEHFIHILLEILPVFFIAVICSSLLEVYLPDGYFEKIGGSAEQAAVAEVNSSWKFSKVLNYQGRVVKRTSSRLRRTNDRSVLNVHEDHEDDENAEIGVSLHAQDAVFETQVYTAIQALKTWSLEDKKITPLKDLQGLIWQEGFRKGLFKAPLYQDALDFFLNMKGKGLPIYVYSSGSIQAQRLFFEFSEFGDIRYLFSGFYDTKIGSKKEYESYLKIADDIKVSPEHILFLTDIKDECRASERAGLLTVQVVREALKDTENLDKSASSNNSIERTRKVINDFSELSEIL